jgi:chromosome segregation ATPase
MQNEDIVFDTSSGISMEEQQEILEGINAMAVGSRLVPEAPVSGVKKKGYIFPLGVNIGALVILGLGFLLLYLFHSSGEQQIRGSTAVLGITERMLIQEIRQETTRLISEKENEINSILSMLSAVDAEYRILHESVETLTEAQRERAAYLLMMHEEYQRSLALLQEERASILEDARLREANLRAQAEERTRELTLRIEQDQASLNEAMEELRRIGSEQERADRIESQMNGFYITVNSQIFAGRLTEASVTLSAMREFLEAPFLQNISGFETRKQNHLAAINFMETAISASLNGVSAGAQAELAELRTRNAALERDIAAFSAHDSDQAGVIAGYAAVIRELENTNENLQQVHRTELAQREYENRTLETENVRLLQQVSELQTRYDDLQSRTEAALRIITGE